MNKEQLARLIKFGKLLLIILVVLLVARVLFSISFALLAWDLSSGYDVINTLYKFKMGVP